VVTPERFAQGMTFDQYVTYIGSPENLAREGSGGGRRVDQSGFFREAFANRRLTDDQEAALKWLIGQPKGPSNMLAISEEWSSDCRRDIPTFARMAAATGMELRIFNRDGKRFSSANVPNPAESPDSADIVAEFLNHKDGQTFQSIPVCVFYTRDMEYLYHFTEYAAIYEKERVVVQHIRSPKPGESPEATRARVDREFGELQKSAFWRIWASATVDQIISALHRKAVLGVV
jgi:hypothetical protein